MYSSCLLLMVQAGGDVDGRGISSQHNLGPEVPTEHHLSTTADRISHHPTACISQGTIKAL